MFTRTVTAVLLAVVLVMAGLGAASPGLGKYQDVDRATADGYVLASPCVPGMGYHYANFELMEDDSVKVSEPEILVYAEGEDGLELVAVEYVSLEEFGLLGDHAHFHPHLGAYAMHAWFFLPNPDGLTADFNPRVNADCTID